MPSTLRWINERQVFERLLRGGPASRAELAKSTGLSAPTVGKVADRLLTAGLVEESTDEPAAADITVGRPSRPLRPNRSRHRFIALQLGVRHTRLAALPVAGPIDDHWPVQFSTPRTPATLARQLRKAAVRLGLAEPWAVMVSVPGVVDEQLGRVLLSPNMHWTEKVDLRRLVAGVWPVPGAPGAPGVPVCLVQEIRALAQGEATGVVGTPPRDFLLVDFGEGMGGAAVIGGRLYEGAMPLSGELGHTPVAGNARPCGCGAVGCVETLVSRRGLIETFAEGQTRGRRRRAGQRTWAGLARHVAEHGVEPWLAESLDAAAGAIAGAINVLGVREVVVTGALTELAPVVMERLSWAVERASMWARFGQVVCRPAPRRRAGGLVAAAIDRVLMPAQGWQQQAGLTLTRPPRRTG